MNGKFSKQCWLRGFENNIFKNAAGKYSCVTVISKLYLRKYPSFWKFLKYIHLTTLHIQHSNAHFMYPRVILHTLCILGIRILCCIPRYYIFCMQTLSVLTWDTFCMKSTQFYRNVLCNLYVWECVFNVNVFNKQSFEFLNRWWMELYKASNS